MRVTGGITRLLISLGKFVVILEAICILLKIHSMENTVLEQ